MIHVQVAFLDAQRAHHQLFVRIVILVSILLVAIVTDVQITV